AQPLARNVGPDLVFDPGLGFVADPARLAREDKRGFAVEREKNIDVAVHDLEARHIKDRAFESGVLVTADDQSVQPLGLHARANVGVTARNFLLTRQIVPPGRARNSYCTPHNSAATSA